jgi:hypothetical protein
MPLLIIFILCSITLSAGIVFGSLALVPVFILTCFAIPSSLEINRKDGIKRYVPLANCMASIIMLLALFTAASWCCYHFLLKGFGGYLVGILISLLIGLYRCGEQRENLADAWRSPGRYAHPKRLIKASQFFLADSEALNKNTAAVLLSAVLRRAGYKSIDE